MSLLLVFLLAVLPSPSPSPSPALGDACGQDGHTNVLAAINRPTVGYSACAVKPHEALLELGAQLNEGDTSQNQFGQGFLRFGVAPNIEVDAIGPAYIDQRLPAPAHGFGDLGAGMKWEVAHDGVSAAGIDLLLTVPTAPAAFTSGVPTMQVNGNYAVSFGKFGVALTAGYLRSRAYDSFLPSIVLSNQYSARAQWYVESFAQSKSSAGAAALFGLDGGLQYMITPQLEVDAEIGQTRSDAARVHYFGAGVGIRL